MEKLLSGKTIIVTGGSRGIGRDTCRVLGRHGANVVVNYAASEEKAQRTVREVEEAGGKAIAVAGDVREPETWERMTQLAVDTFGRLDGIVNNAISGKQDGPFDEASDEDYRTAFEFGCLAVANSIRAAKPHFAKSGGGRIVNIVTEVWNQAGPNWSVYLAGKGAMVGMSRSLANELGPEGITVNMVAPGWMATDKVDTASEGSQKFAQSLPLRRHGSGEEIGKGCVFFLSELGDYVTGAYLPVTGGRVNQMGG
ncbi:SDR family oxidoreductase [bacterium]|nr:MAG: SDR family oxidoreductase [bacterium]